MCISFVMLLTFRTFGFAEGTFIRKSENKLLFLSLFTHLLDKIFTFEQTNSFVFFSLNQIFRTFDFVESTLARK